MSSFDTWSLVGRVQELSVTVGWLRRENTQAKIIIQRLVKAAARSYKENGLNQNLACACKAALEFLAADGQEEQWPQTANPIPPTSAHS